MHGGGIRIYGRYVIITLHKLIVCIMQRLGEDFVVQGQGQERKVRGEGQEERRKTQRLKDKNKTRTCLSLY